LHDRPGGFAHGIEPVGAALDDAGRELVATKAAVAVVLDADADRGNLVLRGRDGRARAIAPQQVAALGTLTMLAWVESRGERFFGGEGRPLAVVAHDATSGLVKAVADRFEAECFGVETGEANVVARMQQARVEGYSCPLGVEGANGGVILGHARVRDGALTGLLAVLGTVDDGTVVRLEERWDRLPQDRPLELIDLLEAMPEWHTLQETLRAEEAPIDPAALRAGFERNLLAARLPTPTGLRLEGLEGAEFTSIEVLNYEETEVRRGIGNRRSQTGGLKVLLRDDAGREHFLWFRGSKTEAGVTRIVADSPDGGIATGLMALTRRLLPVGLDA
jgi:phosphomannomutase